MAVGFDLLKLLQFHVGSIRLLIPGEPLAQWTPHTHLPRCRQRGLRPCGVRTGPDLSCVCASHQLPGFKIQEVASLSFELGWHTDHIIRRHLIKRGSPTKRDNKIDYRPAQIPAVFEAVPLQRGKLPPGVGDIHRNSFVVLFERARPETAQPGFLTTILEGRGFTGCGKTPWRLNLRQLQPPRRSARHPSSTEEGSVFNSSPPGSGGVARRATGWLSAGTCFSAACLAPPLWGPPDFPDVPRPARLAAAGCAGLGTKSVWEP